MFTVWLHLHLGPPASSPVPKRRHCRGACRKEQHGLSEGRHAGRSEGLLHSVGLKRELQGGAYLPPAFAHPGALVTREQLGTREVGSYGTWGRTQRWGYCISDPGFPRTPANPSALICTA